MTGVVNDMGTYHGDVRLGCLCGHLFPLAGPQLPRRFSSLRARGGETSDRVRSLQCDHYRQRGLHRRHGIGYQGAKPHREQGEKNGRMCMAQCLRFRSLYRSDCLHRGICVLGLRWLLGRAVFR